MTDEVFNNVSRKAIRIFLLIAAGLAVIAAIPLATVWILSMRGGASADTRQNCFIIAMIALPLILAMLFSALLTIPTARKTDRAFDEFRRGELLARWDYPADFWQAYVDREFKRLTRTAWLLFGFILLVSGGLGLFLSIAVPTTRTAKLEGASIAVAILIAVTLVIGAAITGVIRMRRKALLDCPRAYISKDAIYCGGIFNFWGSQLRGLRSLRIEPGDSRGKPAMLAFTIGFSPRARRAVAVVDAINLAMLRPAVTSSYVVRQAIPVPPGRDEEAQAIVHQLKSPPAAPAHANPVPASMPAGALPAAGTARANPTPARVPLPAAYLTPGSTLPPQAISLRRSARRWLAITAALLLGGLCIFLVAGSMAPTGPNKPPQSALITSVEVIALFAWLFSPVTIVIAAVKWTRSRRS